MVDRNDGRPDKHCLEPLGAEALYPIADLGLMMKYWNPGTVKTRLAATIGFQKASQLHRIFVHHLCQSLAQAGQNRTLVLAPDDHVDTLRGHLQELNLGDAWAVAPQGKGDLGQRMERWFTERLNQDHRASAVLIGADCPLLTRDEIQQAFVAMNQVDVVLGPAADGGYYLIGIRSVARMKERLSQLFADVPWSTSEVLEITRQRIEQCGLSLSLLVQREDVDTISELTRLRQHLKAQTGRLAELGEAIERVLRSDDSSNEPAGAMS